jgi:hypothetical protein
MSGKKFKIDFFELSFLVEACIPPRPIARSMFWDEVINVYYHQMSWDERRSMFDWLSRNPTFTDGLVAKNKQVEAFEARFNPDKQFMVYSNWNGDDVEHHCFLLDGKYYVEYYAGSRSRWIASEFILRVEKIDVL